MVVQNPGARVGDHRRDPLAGVAAEAFDLRDVVMGHQRGRDAAQPQRRRRLAADEPGADDHCRRGVLRRVAEPVRPLEGPQQQRSLTARHRRRRRPRARRDHQPSVRVGAARGGHLSRGRVDAGDLADPDVDVALGEPVGLLQTRVGGLGLTAQELLAQRRPLVGQCGVVGQHGDRGVGVVLSERRRRAQSGGAASDDEEARRLHRTGYPVGSGSTRSRQRRSDC